VIGNSSVLKLLNPVCNYFELENSSKLLLVVQRNSLMSSERPFKNICDSTRDYTSYPFLSRSGVTCEPVADEGCPLSGVFNDCLVELVGSPVVFQHDIQESKDGK